MAGGRSWEPASPPCMTPAPLWLARAAALLSLLLVGCPQLETPLSTVSGRVIGAHPGAFAYPLGRADLRVSLALPDGSFRIDGVPTGVEALILYDGAARAELAPVALQGGETNRLADRFGTDAVLAPEEEGRRMPLAATVLLAALPEGGASATGASYTVVGTHLEARIQLDTEYAVELYPLPAGRFTVRAALGGFLEAGAAIDAISGATTPLALPLDIDADSALPGCASAVACDNDLICSAVDGRCYACQAASDCDPGERCELAAGLCMPDSGAPAATVCSACIGDAGCASGVCVVPAGETIGYCSQGCAAPQDCPAGFACAGSRCVAPDGCDDWLQTMGAPCIGDADCSADLAGGWCEHAPDAAGTCTAGCAVDADCRLGTGAASTFVCRPGGRLGSYCAP